MFFNVRKSILILSFSSVYLEGLCLQGTFKNRKFRLQNIKKQISLQGRIAQ